MNNYRRENESPSYSNLFDMGIIKGPFYSLIEYFGLFSFILLSLISSIFFTVIFRNIFNNSTSMIEFYETCYYEIPLIGKHIQTILPVITGIVTSKIAFWIFGIILFHKLKTNLSWPAMILRFSYGFGTLILVLWLFTINVFFSLLCGLILLLLQYFLQGYSGNKVTSIVSTRNNFIRSQGHQPVSNFSPEEDLAREFILGGNYVNNITNGLINGLEKNIELGETELRKGYQEARYEELQYLSNILSHKIKNLRYDKLLMTYQGLNAIKHAGLETLKLENLIKCEKLIGERNKAHLLAEIAHYKAVIAEMLTLFRNMQMRNNRGEYTDSDY